MWCSRCASAHARDRRFPLRRLRARDPLPAFRAPNAQVKTNRAERYTVKPHLGLLEPREARAVHCA